MLTFRGLPPMSFPSSSLTALSANSSVAIVTKPNPLDLPDILSEMTTESVTSPTSEKIVLSSSAVALYGKFPTYSLFFCSSILLGPLAGLVPVLMGYP